MNDEQGRRLLCLSIGGVVVILTLFVAIGGRCACKRAEATFSKVTQTIGAKESESKKPSPAKSAEELLVRED